MTVPNLKVVPPPEEKAAGPLSLDEAFRLHSAYVATLAMRVLGRRDEVEDAVHDTFLAAHGGLKTLRHPSEARTWLTTVALRIARRRLRVRKVRGWVGFDEVADNA